MTDIVYALRHKTTGDWWQGGVTEWGPNRRIFLSQKEVIANLDYFCTDGTVNGVSTNKIEVVPIELTQKEEHVYSLSGLWPEK